MASTETMKRAREILAMVDGRPLDLRLKAEGYTVIDGEIDAPCGCYACDNGVQPGHAYCNCPPQSLIDLERQGKIRRELNGSWAWKIN